MEIADQTAVITGGASGIGLAIAERFIRAGAREIIIADLESSAVAEVAERIGAHARICDVTREDEVKALVDDCESAFGPLDIFVSNAGIFLPGSEHAPDSEWKLCWDLHVMAHVYAARAVAGLMAKRGRGYLVNTSSAAGLLTHINSASYAVSKHAAIAFAEYLAIEYGPQGVCVSVLCPQSVRTPMTDSGAGQLAKPDTMIEPELLADCVVDAMARESFLILPHPEVQDYMQRKTADYDRWLGGMQRMKQRRRSENPSG